MAYLKMEDNQLGHGHKVSLYSERHYVLWSDGNESILASFLEAEGLSKDLRIPLKIEDEIKDELVKVGWQENPNLNFSEDERNIFEEPKENLYDETT